MPYPRVTEIDHSGNGPTTILFRKNQVVTRYIAMKENLLEWWLSEIRPLLNNQTMRKSTVPIKNNSTKALFANSLRSQCFGNIRVPMVVSSFRRLRLRCCLVQDGQLTALLDQFNMVIGVTSKYEDGGAGGIGKAVKNTPTFQLDFSMSESCRKARTEWVTL